MIRRSAEKIIDKWIENGRNAMLVSGARQVGKTYTIRECLKRGGCDYLEINLVEHPEYVSIFESARTVDELVMELTVATSYRFRENESILFIDEVQEYSDIVTRIKFWVDDGRFRYIMSGSLLGIELNDLRSAPVGYMDELQMFPLDFEEFILASGVTPDVVEYLNGHFIERQAVSDTIHQKMMTYYSRYLVVGGMPAAVAQYLENGDMNDVADIQQNIISMYKRDFTKYESKDKKLMLEAVYDLIPSELLKQNRRFNYADIKKGLRFERLEDSFLWLNGAGVAICTHNATEPRIALRQNMKSSLVKLYLSDVGLLLQLYGRSAKLEILTGSSSLNLGGVYENAVAMELLRHGYDLYYYNSRKLGELDFVIEHKSRALPIEVKSGKDYYVHSAIDNVLGTADFDINEAIVFSNYNVSVDGNTIYYPIYMSTFLRDDALLPILDPVIL